jgi:hypothetical protein
MKRKAREPEGFCVANVFAAVMDGVIRSYLFNVAMSPHALIELARVYFMSSNSSFAYRISAQKWIACSTTLDLEYTLGVLM